MVDIPNEVAQFGVEGQIPKAVAELPQQSEEPEIRPYVISFAKYNERLCEIEALGKNKGNRALSILKKIGTQVYSRADFQRSNIKTSLINNSGEYRKLYNKLAPDVEVKEMFLQSTGRIFYFDVEPERMLYVVAITENHFETEKTRR